jgi:hypothetical protein
MAKLLQIHPQKVTKSEKAELENYTMKFDEYETRR